MALISLIERSLKRLQCFKTIRQTSVRHFRNGLNYSSVKTLLNFNELELPKTLITKGWIKRIRKQKNFIFLNIYDGSCIGDETLQVIIDKNNHQNLPLSYGSAVNIKGSLIKSNHPQQAVELQGEEVQVVGECNTEDFPLKVRQKHPLETLRQEPHLRLRNPIFASMLRVRSVAHFHIHKYLKECGFLQIHSPVLTSNDCEGAGQTFTVKPSDSKEGDHFFGKPVYLTVSSQLHLEAAASSLEKVYSLGPTFRAENSRTRQHLSEFYMLEIEQAFLDDLDQLIQLFDDIFKNVGRIVFDECSRDLELLNEQCDVEGHFELVRKALEKPILKINYDEAIEVLEKHRKKFKLNLKWGDDLSSDHEQFLIEHCGQGLPVAVTHYPKIIKPFYMKETGNLSKDSQLTVECFDVLAPIGGEICGGSLRIHQYEILKRKLEEMDDVQTLNWYLELRNFGCPPHGGFGLGFDRFLQFLTRVPNIREVVPFPRWSQHCAL